MRAALIALGLIAALASPALAERLASTVSSENVRITSSFDGTTLSLFGNIEPDTGSGLKYVEGPYQVIIAVTGPLQDRVARLKTNSFGIWTNSQEVLFKEFPSYYQVISSAKLASITDEATLHSLAIQPIEQALATARADSGRAEEFGTELVRLMTEEQHFGVNEGGVNFLSNTAYTAQVPLPSDVANGPFIAHTMVFKNGALVAEHSAGFSVRKTGLESFVFVASRQYPLVYGLVCVLLALGTGWLGGVVFRR